MCLAQWANLSIGSRQREGISLNGFLVCCLRAPRDLPKEATFSWTSMTPSVMPSVRSRRAQTWSQTQYLARQHPSV